MTPVQIHVKLYAFLARTVVLCLSREDEASGTMTYVKGPILLSYTKVYTSNIAPIAHEILELLWSPKLTQPTIIRITKALARPVRKIDRRPKALISGQDSSVPTNASAYRPRPM